MGNSDFYEEEPFFPSYPEAL
ncbi:uncharacterized protein G2W53_032909 [Senna tora]|uniref:Uncharacterized protein n=1 Tax=Senna tora TaxID=362788 RepID=A0A834SYB4_9FABA|nr:uncharacterized protein G2W53_032909 [Senna tora]